MWRGVVERLDLMPVLAAIMALAVVPVALAQTVSTPPAGLIAPVTQGKGPAERVTDFQITPTAAQQRLRSDAIGRLGQALVAKSGEAQRQAELDLAVQVLGDTQGSLAGVGVVAEHALWLEQFSDVNNAMNNIGFAMGLAQVARDGWNGNDAAALTGGIKAWMNFAIGRWGTGAMQIGAIGAFVVDVTLRQWQSGLGEIAHDVQACHYLAWYKEHPRSVGEWKAAAWDLYLAAEKDTSRPYSDYLDKALDEYVGRAFKDLDIATYGDCGTSSFGQRATVEQQVAAEHKAVLQRMLADKVMPEIGERAWLRTLRAQAADARARLMPALNRQVVLEVTAYGYPGGTKVVMPLPSGGTWQGKLRDDGGFKTQITLFAIQKAGYPDTVRLEGPNGPEERKLTFNGAKLTAMFGAPETPVIARYTLNEGAATCQQRRIEGDAVSTETTTAPARGDHPVDFAMLPTGAWVVGQYEVGKGWSVASPGTVSTTAMSFGAPLYDGITGFDGCKIGVLAEGSLAEGGCTVKRFEAKQISAKVRVERTCTAPAKLTLSGIIASVVAGQMQYYPLDGPEGKMIVDLLRQGVSKGVEGGMPTGMPGMPQLPGAKP